MIQYCRRIIIKLIKMIDSTCNTQGTSGLATALRDKSTFTIPIQPNRSLPVHPAPHKPCRSVFPRRGLSNNTSTTTSTTTTTIISSPSTSSSSSSSQTSEITNEVNTSSTTSLLTQQLSQPTLGLIRLVPNWQSEIQIPFINIVGITQHQAQNNNDKNNQSINNNNNNLNSNLINNKNRQGRKRKISERDDCVTTSDCLIDISNSPERLDQTLIINETKLLTINDDDDKNQNDTIKKKRKKKSKKYDNILNNNCNDKLKIVPPLRLKKIQTLQNDDNDNNNKKLYNWNNVDKIEDVEEPAIPGFRFYQPCSTSTIYNNEERNSPPILSNATIDEIQMTWPETKDYKLLHNANNKSTNKNKIDTFDINRNSQNVASSMITTTADIHEDNNDNDEITIDEKPELLDLSKPEIKNINNNNNNEIYDDKKILDMPSICDENGIQLNNHNDNLENNNYDNNSDSDKLLIDTTCILEEFDDDKTNKKLNDKIEIVDCINNEDNDDLKLNKNLGNVDKLSSNIQSTISSSSSTTCGLNLSREIKNNNLSSIDETIELTIADQFPTLGNWYTRGGGGGGGGGNGDDNNYSYHASQDLQKQNLPVGQGMPVIQNTTQNIQRAMNKKRKRIVPDRSGKNCQQQNNSGGNVNNWGEQVWQEHQLQFAQEQQRKQQQQQQQVLQNFGASNTPIITNVTSIANPSSGVVVSQGQLSQQQQNFINSSSPVITNVTSILSSANIMAPLGQLSQQSGKERNIEQKQRQKQVPQQQQQQVQQQHRQIQSQHPQIQQQHPQVQQQHPQIQQQQHPRIQQQQQHPQVQQQHPQIQQQHPQMQHVLPEFPIGRHYPQKYPMEAYGMPSYPGYAHPGMPASSGFWNVPLFQYPHLRPRGMLNNQQQQQQQQQQASRLSLPYQIPPNTLAHPRVGGPTPRPTAYHHPQNPQSIQDPKNSQKLPEIPRNFPAKPDYSQLHLQSTGINNQHQLPSSSSSSSSSSLSSSSSTTGQFPRIYNEHGYRAEQLNQQYSYRPGWRAPLIQTNQLINQNYQLDTNWTSDPRNLLATLSPATIQNYQTTPQALTKNNKTSNNNNNNLLMRNCETPNLGEVNYSLNNSNTLRCSNCSSRGPLFKCLGCEVAFYCDETCQVRHWNTHVLSCPKIMPKLRKVMLN